MRFKEKICVLKGDIVAEPMLEVEMVQNTSDEVFSLWNPNQSRKNHKEFNFYPKTISSKTSTLSNHFAKH